MSNYITINSENLNTDAMRPFDLLPLLGNVDRGDNRVLPGATGRRPFAGVRDEIDTTINWFCDGRVTYTGTPQAPVAGLSINLEHYRALFMDSGDATTGLIAAVIHLPDRDVQASIQIRDWTPVWGRSPFMATVATRIIVPAGIWTTVPP